MFPIFATALWVPDIVKRMGNDIQLIGSTPQEFERYYLQEHERRRMSREAV